MLSLIDTCLPEEGNWLLAPFCVLSPWLGSLVMRGTGETFVELMSELNISHGFLPLPVPLFSLTMPALFFGAGECPSVPAFL